MAPSHGYEDQVPATVSEKCRSCPHRAWAEFFREEVHEGEQIADSLHDWLDGGKCTGVATVTKVEHGWSYDTAICTNQLIEDESKPLMAHYNEAMARMSGQLIVKQAERELG